jgi:hypothetical protein
MMHISKYKEIRDNNFPALENLLTHSVSQTHKEDDTHALLDPQGQTRFRPADTNSIIFPLPIKVTPT